MFTDKEMMAVHVLQVEEGHKYTCKSRCSCCFILWLTKENMAFFLTNSE